MSESRIFNLASKAFPSNLGTSKEFKWKTSFNSILSSSVPIVPERPTCLSYCLINSS